MGYRTFISDTGEADQEREGERCPVLGGSFPERQPEAYQIRRGGSYDNISGPWVEVDPERLPALTLRAGQINPRGMARLTSAVFKAVEDSVPLRFGIVDDRDEFHQAYTGLVASAYLPPELPWRIVYLSKEIGGLSPESASTVDIASRSLGRTFNLNPPLDPGTRHLQYCEIVQQIEQAPARFGFA